MNMQTNHLDGFAGLRNLSVVTLYNSVDFDSDKSSSPRASICPEGPGIIADQTLGAQPVSLPKQLGDINV
jgi:hypothetical protein